jgi:hypothetical protein
MCQHNGFKMQYAPEYGEAAPLRFASMPKESPLPLNPESGGAGPNDEPSCMSHLLSQGPDSRQFTDPWSDTLQTNRN